MLSDFIYLTRGSGTRVLLQLPQWLQDASPFEHLPMVPAEDFAWGPMLAVAGVAVLLSVAGQVAFRRLDVH